MEVDPSLMKKPTRLPLGLFGHIWEDFVTNSSRIGSTGFHALVVHRFGVWTLEVAPHRWTRAPLTLIYNGMAGFVRNFYGMELPRDTKIGRRVQIIPKHCITIHHTAEIGDDCMIRQNVSIGAAERYGQAPKLGHHVEVGAGAVLIGDIRIGSNVRIGPNAVVTVDVPDGAVVVAPAARVLLAKRVRTCAQRGIERQAEYAASAASQN